MLLLNVPTPSQSLTASSVCESLERSGHDGTVHVGGRGLDGDLSGGLGGEDGAGTFQIVRHVRRSDGDLHDPPQVAVPKISGSHVDYVPLARNGAPVGAEEGVD